MSTALKQTNEQTNKRTNKNNLGPLCPSLKASTRFQLSEKKKRKADSAKPRSGTTQMNA